MLAAAIVAVMLMGSVPSPDFGPTVQPGLLDGGGAGRLVRVVVQIAVDYEPPETVALAQDKVLATLVGTPHRLLNRYGNGPYLGLEVGADALRVLAANPRVLSVWSDPPRR